MHAGPATRRRRETGTWNSSELSHFRPFCCCPLTTLCKILKFVTVVTSAARAGGHYCLRLDFVPPGSVLHAHVRSGKNRGFLHFGCRLPIGGFGARAARKD